MQHKKGTIMKESDNLYLMAFIDTVDRFNILLSEIRHLQQTIIYSLHTPLLFLPLRDEEENIFGGWAKNKKLQDDLEKKRAFAYVASQCVQRYPEPYKAIRYVINNPKVDITTLPNTKDKLLAAVGHTWTTDLWTDSERLHYYGLSALQILKQQVLHDKLIFVTEAQGAEIVALHEKPHINHEKTAKPLLMILRSAVLSRINRYIRVLRTHQQNFGKSLTFGIQHYPQPNLERRRDIGIYSDFLSNRTHDMQHNMLNFIEEFNSDHQDNPKPVILHGWSQSPIMSASQLHDVVSMNLMKDGKYDMPTQHISYIDTSFWAPDRPDLQPLVAKQVANSIIGSHMEHLSDHYLSNNVNSFSNLIVTLQHVISQHNTEISHDRKLVEKYRTLIIKDLAADFLATAVKGTAYLYAQFLAVLGKGLENLLCDQRGQIKLMTLHDLSHGVTSYEEYFVWYFRLRLNAFFMRQIAYTKLSSLDKMVVKGTQQICEDIVTFLDQKARSTTKPVGQRWKNLAEEMEKIIKKHHFVWTARQWRLKRNRDTWCDQKNKAGKKKYHRSTIRLDMRLREFLFRGTLQQKQEMANKPLSQGLDESLQDEFQQIYGLQSEPMQNPEIPRQHHFPRWLYRHLHQIPFQCAIMRSIDLQGNRLGEASQPPSFLSLSKKKYHAKSTNSQGKTQQPRKHHWRDFMTEVHTDMSLGREKFSLGLEFYTWDRESSRNRLSLCNNLINFVLPSLKKDFSEVYEHLSVWLHGAESKHNTPKYLKKLVKQSSHQQLKHYFCGHRSPELERVGSKTISHAFSYIRGDRCIELRRLEQLAGYKLMALLALYEQPIVSDDKNSPLIKTIKWLRAIGGYLTIRGDKGKERFYSLILKAFNGTTNANKLPKRIPPVLISRSALSNHYLLTTNLAQKNTHITSERAHTKALQKTIRQHSWIQSFVNEPEHQKGLLVSVLGRYDVVGITPARLPCKCRVISFDDDNNKKNEEFASHFTRREVALPVNIYNMQCYDNICDVTSPVFTFLSISLQRRSMRLSFLYRILDAVAAFEATNDKTSAKEQEPHYFAGVGMIVLEILQKLSPYIRIQGYLTDGWGDLLLAITLTEKGEKSTSAEKNKLIDAMFDLQKTFYEDFMVDRTELVFTSRCIDYIAAHDDYHFNFTLRMLEDRKLEYSIDNFIKSIEDKVDQLPEWVDKDKFKLATTSGKTDFTLYITAKKNSKASNVHHDIFNWLALKNDHTDNTWHTDGLSLIDKIETRIERKIKSKR